MTVLQRERSLTQMPRCVRFLYHPVAGSCYKERVQARKVTGLLEAWRVPMTRSRARVRSSDGTRGATVLPVVKAIQQPTAGRRYGFRSLWAQAFSREAEGGGSLQRCADPPSVSSAEVSLACYSTRSMTSRTVQDNRKDMIATGLHAARAVSIVKKTSSGRDLEAPDIVELQTVRDAISDALKATQYVDSPARSSSDRRNLATVRLAITAASRHSARESDQRDDVATLSASLAARLEDLNSLIASKPLADSQPLLNYLSGLVELATRGAAGRGETLHRGDQTS